MVYVLLGLRGDKDIDTIVRAHIDVGLLHSGLHSHDIRTRGRRRRQMVIARGAGLPYWGSRVLSTDLAGVYFVGFVLYTRRTDIKSAAGVWGLFWLLKSATAFGGFGGRRVEKARVNRRKVHFLSLAEY
jgi:hypothetical protein